MSAFWINITILEKGGNMEKKENRGGTRAGSGRKKIDKKNRVDNQPSTTQFASHQPKQIETDYQQQNQVNSDSDYNPNYVIINGKPVYNEQEAIAVTEDTFNFFASNVTQTINHAESAQNVSEDVIKIIKF